MYHPIVYNFPSLGMHEAFIFCLNFFAVITTGVGYTQLAACSSPLPSLEMLWASWSPFFSIYFQLNFLHLNLSDNHLSLTEQFLSKVVFVNYIFKNILIKDL